MPAPILPDTRETIHRMTLGDMQLCTVVEGAIKRDAVKPPFMLDRSDAEIAAIAAAANLPADRMEHIFVPAVVNTGKELVLFDVGFGAEGGAAMGAGRLVQGLAALGYRPEDVDVVAFTHMHPDHIQGIGTAEAPTFPNARYVMGRVEYDEWLSGDRIPEQRKGNRDMFLSLIPPHKDRLELVEDGASIVSGITAEAGFGHSLGHMMYRIESQGKQILLWGDVTNHYVFSLRHPEAKVFFDDDPDTAVQTRKRVLAMVADDGLMVAGFHMPFPSVGHVERVGNSYTWVPASYQLRV